MVKVVKYLNMVELRISWDLDQDGKSEMLHKIYAK